MAGQYGVKETKEALDLALGAVKAAQAINADAKVDLNDLQHLLPLLPMIQPAFDKIDLVPKELGELTAEESAEIVGHIAAGLNVTGAKAKIYIEYGLKIVHKGYMIFVDVKDMQAALAKAV